MSKYTVAQPLNPQKWRQVAATAGDSACVAVHIVANELNDMDDVDSNQT